MFLLAPCKILTSCLPSIAHRSMKAVDNGERTVFMPSYMFIGMALYWLWPSFIEKKAREKYRFAA